MFVILKNKQKHLPSSYSFESTKIPMYMLHYFHHKLKIIGIRGQHYYSDQLQLEILMRIFPRPCQVAEGNLKFTMIKSNLKKCKNDQIFIIK